MTPVVCDACGNDTAQRVTMLLMVDDWPAQGQSDATRQLQLQHVLPPDSITRILCEQCRAKIRALVP
jgi:hypothetical protein